MKKNEFLEELKFELKKIKCNDIDSVLEYYEEFINEEIENGKKEKEIIKKIGDITDIAKEVKIEQRIDTAYEKPSISNGIKALIATLSILSLPLLIPLLITVGALIFTSIIILGAFVIVIGALAFSALAMIFALFGALLFNNLPFGAFVLGVGIAMILSGVFILALKYLMLATKWTVTSLSKFLKRKFSQRKGGRDYE